MDGRVAFERLTARTKRYRTYEPAIVDMTLLVAAPTTTPLSMRHLAPLSLTLSLTLTLSHTKALDEALRPSLTHTHSHCGDTLSHSHSHPRAAGHRICENGPTQAL